MDQACLADMRKGRLRECCVAAQSSHARRPLLAALLWCKHGSMVPSLILPRGRMQVGDRALAQADPKAALRAVMKSWLPLSEAVLGMAVEQLPDPMAAAPERLPRLLALDALDALDPSLTAPVQQVGLFGSCRLRLQRSQLQLKYPRSLLQQIKGL